MVWRNSMALTLTLPTSEDSIKWQGIFMILYLVYHIVFHIGWYAYIPVNILYLEELMHRIFLAHFQYQSIELVLHYGAVKHAHQSFFSHQKSGLVCPCSANVNIEGRANTQFSVQRSFTPSSFLISATNMLVVLRNQSSF